MAKITRAWALAGSIAIAGCSVTTDFPSQKDAGVGEVANRIQCQLRDVVNALAVRYPQFKQNWSGGFKLILQAQRKAGGKFKPLEWTIPAGGSLKLAGSAEGSEDTVRKIETDYVFKLTDLDNLTCSQPMVRVIRASEGLFEPIVEYIPNFYDNRLVGLDEKPSVTYEVTFIISHSADLGPTFTIVNLTATANASRSRTDTNKIVASFVRNPPGTIAVARDAASSIQDNIREFIQPEAVKDFFRGIANE